MQDTVSPDLAWANPRLAPCRSSEEDCGVRASDSLVRFPGANAMNEAEFAFSANFIMECNDCQGTATAWLFLHHHFFVARICSQQLSVCRSRD
eukprot:1162119-Pelagomonas_calceolata.AAC.5